MNEEQNIEKDSGNQISNPNEEKPSEASQTPNVPATSNQELETTSQAKPESSDMETHAHHFHQAPGHGWRHYVFEFFMLFLAVFCGFIAENQREHVVEHRREKQYMKSLVEDLEKDTIDFKNDIPFWEVQRQRIDTLRKEIDKLPNERNKKTLYVYSGYMRWYEKFVYHDRTIMQLKNGGNFRLIGKREIADSLIDYDATVNSTLRDIEAISNNIWQSLNLLQGKIFNTRYYSPPGITLNLDSAENVDPRPIEVITTKKDELFEYYNLLDYYRGLNMVRNMVNRELLNKAVNLIVEIKREYSIE